MFPIVQLTFSVRKVGFLIKSNRVTENVYTYDKDQYSAVPHKPNGNKGEIMALVSGQLNFSVLKTCIEYKHDTFQPMSIALPNTIISDIIKIQNSENHTNEQKQRYVESELNKTNLCEGYFFNNDNQVLSSTSFRHLYLETCDENLDTFIRKYTKKNDFQWTVLQEMCYQLVDSVAWLHQGNFYYDGRLHPRNILVKRSRDPKWNVKLKIPEKLNPFNNLDELYTQCWSTVKKPVSQETAEEQLNQVLQRDFISIGILLYFIQSAGYHPFQLGGSNNLEADYERDNYKDIKIQIESGIFKLEALDKKCFCNAEMECDKKMECKYRLWINSLAKDHITKMLTNQLLQKNEQSYVNQSVEKLKEHPFFWKTTDVLTFIERSSNYLNEGKNEEKKKKFDIRSNSKGGKVAREHGPRLGQPWLLDPSIFLELEKNGENESDYKSILEFLHESKNPHNHNFTLMKNVTSFRELLKQIRNKSCHWNEETDRGKKAKEVLKNIRFLSFKEIGDGQISFCLFWLIHFPTLLLYTWEQLKDEIALQYS